MSTTELHDDDKPVGRLLTRREMLALLGGGSAALISGLTFPQLVKAQDPTSTPTALPACVVRPELTEGPYFVDEQLNRFDIRVDPADDSIVAGLPLYLIYRVSDVTGGQCGPLSGAQVDVWHCDSEGQYSGVQDRSFDTSGQMWLRGYQVTDEDGIAEFLTIVPGWYSGRAVHIHFKIRLSSDTEEAYEFTSQLFFDPDQIEEIYSNKLYAARGLPDTPNDSDNIYQGSDGLLTLDLVEMGDDDFETIAEHEDERIEVTSGYKAIFDIGLDLSDTAVGASDSAGQGGGPRGGGPGRR